MSREAWRRPEGPTRLPDALQFMRLLWEIVHGLEAISKRMRHTIGLTGPQRLVLRIVGLAPGISAGGLAQVLHVHPSTLTGVLQRLSRQRLMTRIVDRDDRRRVGLFLTARGARLNSVTPETAEARIARLLARLTPRQRASARAALAAFAEAVSARPPAPAAARASRPRRR